MSQPTIDTSRPIVLFDDRGKSETDLYLSKILFENDTVVLGEANSVVSMSARGTIEQDEQDHPLLVLFSKADGEVLTEDLFAWIAENSEDVCIPTAERQMAGGQDGAHQPGGARRHR